MFSAPDGGVCPETDFGSATESSRHRRNIFPESPYEIVTQHLLKSGVCVVRFLNIMNPLTLFLSPQIFPQEAGTATRWDRLARELSEEWCDTEPEDEESSQSRNANPYQRARPLPGGGPGPA